MVVAGFTDQVLCNKLRDDRKRPARLKVKHTLFSGTVFDCDVLVATKLFGPRLDEESFKVATGLGDVMEKPTGWRCHSASLNKSKVAHIIFEEGLISMTWDSRRFPTRVEDDGGKRLTLRPTNCSSPTAPLRHGIVN